MIGAGFFQGLKDRMPSSVAAVCQLSLEAQQKFVELIARKANLVSKEDFERQKQICMRLLDRIQDLEQQLAELKNKNQ